MKRWLAAAALLALAACWAEPPTTADGADAALQDQLAALGYVDWAPIDAGQATRSGVVRHDVERSQPGVNLYSSRALPGAWLVDMQGRVLHAWRAPEGAPGWNHVAWAGDGELLVLSQAPALQRIDRDSKLLWERRLRVHHDLAIDADGSLHVLERTRAEVRIGDAPRQVLGENLLRLAPDGRELSRTPIHTALGSRVTPEQWAAAAAATPDPRTPWQRLRAGWRSLPADVYHANSLAILPRDVPGLGAAGDTLVSLRNLDLLVVLGRETGEVGWSFGPGVLARQHHASLLANDDVLVFDNGRGARGSRVVEVDPRTREIVWSDSGTPDRPLLSRSQGAAQSLVNGNVLVTESERGRAVEITRSGAIVWEFLNPQLDAARGARASIYRMTRLPKAAARDLLRR